MVKEGAGQDSDSYSSEVGDGERVKVEGITDITLEIQLAINGNAGGSGAQDSNLQPLHTTYNLQHGIGRH